MRSSLFAALGALLIASPAVAYDASKAPRYASPDMYRPNVDGIIVNGLGSAGQLPNMGVTFPGGTFRSFLERLQQTVSVLDYGAKCDGTTNDTAAINAALTSGAKVVRVPPRYCLAGGVTVPAGVALEGDGDSSILFAPAGTAVSITLGSTSTVRRLQVDGNADQQAAGSDCIRAPAVYGVTIDDVRLFRCRQRSVSFLSSTDAANKTISRVINSRLVGTYEGDNIYWENASNLLISRNVLSGAAQGGFGDGGSSAFSSQDISILDNTIIGSTNGGYLRTQLTNVGGANYIDPSKAYTFNITIRGNTFRDQNFYGIIVGASDVLIDGNRFLNVGHPEVLSNFTNSAINGPGRRITVTHNTFEGIGGNAFDAGGTDGCVFSDNVVKSVNAYGLELNSTQNCVASGNDIYTTWLTTSAQDPKRAAIIVSQDISTILPSLRGRSSSNRITNNTIRKLGGATRAIYVKDDASDTQATLTYIASNIAKGFGAGTTIENGSPSTVLRDNTTDDAATANGAWVSYTPNLSCPSGTLTSATATGKYFISPGGAVQFQAAVAITTNGSCAGYGLIVSLPRQISSVGGKVIGRASTGSGVISGDLAPYDSNAVFQAMPNGGYPGGDGATLSVSGTYLPN